jgi:AraC-like DNA-binding protein
MAIKIRVTNNATIELDDIGEGAPVLFLHGFPATRYLWSGVVPLLVNSGYRLLVPDLLGYGASDAPDAFTIVFQPGGVSTLFSVPAEELTNEDFEGEAVLGRGLGKLLRRLCDVSSFTDRARVADAYLCGKRPALDSISSITNAATRMLTSSGCIRVSDLAHQAGLGIRQFERRFRREIGIPPKLYARIVRFEAALRRQAAAPETRWGDIAHDLGYYDQMHMVHDFNRLSGDSPTGIGSQLGMFVQPEVVSAARPQ